MDADDPGPARPERDDGDDPCARPLPTALAAPPAEAPRPAPDHKARWITAGALGGLGLAGVIVGSVFGMRASGQYEDANRSCQGRYCTEPGLEGHADARRSAAPLDGRLLRGRRGAGRRDDRGREHPTCEARLGGRADRARDRAGDHRGRYVLIGG